MPEVKGAEVRPGDTLIVHGKPWLVASMEPADEDPSGFIEKGSWLASGEPGSWRLMLGPQMLYRIRPRAVRRGQRIRVTECPGGVLEPGWTGTVDIVDSLGTVHAIWDAAERPEKPHQDATLHDTCLRFGVNADQGDDYEVIE